MNSKVKGDTGAAQKLQLTGSGDFIVSLHSVPLFFQF